MKARRMEALLAMARQDDSPHERDIARAKLTELGLDWKAGAAKAQPGARVDWDDDLERAMRNFEERARRQQEARDIAEALRKRAIEERFNWAIRARYPQAPRMSIESVRWALEQALQANYRPGAYGAYTSPFGNPGTNTSSASSTWSFDDFMRWLNTTYEPGIRQR